MILFGSTLSPYVRKVAICFAEKGIGFELRSTGFPDRDPLFAEASPFGKMPALVDGDYKLADSSAIIHYIEALRPDPALLPKDPRQLGKAIWFDEFADTILTASGAKIFFNRVVAPRFLKREGDLEVAAAAERDELPALFAYLERTVPDAGAFLVGDRLTLADISVASPFVNFDLCDIAVDCAAYPRLAAYLAAIHARPSFAAVIERDRQVMAATA
jgi:glutathione S-transferase